MKPDVPKRVYIGGEMLNCVEWRKELRSWLEGRATDTAGRVSVPRPLQGHAEQCPSCMARLMASLVLFDSTSSLVPVPEGSVEKAIRRVSDIQGQYAWGGKARRQTIWRGPVRKWILLPVAASILLLVLFVPVVKSGLFSGDIHSDMITVRFVLEAPTASNVSVVGDWNGWQADENHLSDADGDGVWELQIRLRRGNEYRYQFIIDNEKWIPDPRSSFQVEDGFGGFNSILQI